MISFNIKCLDDGKLFITDFTTPDGVTVYKDINDPESIGFKELIGYEGHKAVLNYSDGRTEHAFITNITDDSIAIHRREE